MSTVYHIPSDTVRIEYEIAKSRFICTVGYADTTNSAKAFLSAIKSEMPDASHHVYAFRVGFEPSVIEGMSDDGEPSGTSGPPTLQILRGSGIGDIVVVTTRYFGGTKLGTGGLVRAYSQALHEALAVLPTELKIEKVQFAISLSYTQYNIVKNAFQNYDIEIEYEDFGASIELIINIVESQFESFQSEVRDLTAGQVVPFQL